jgi:urease accessory protein
MATADGEPASRPGPAGGRVGGGAIAVERVAGRSAIVSARATDPLKLLTPRRAGAAAWVYTSTYGGGLVSGDTVSLQLTVGGGAAAVLATQASTKVYRSGGADQATQRLEASVGPGGVLAVLPDPVSPFADSRFSQRQRFDLDPSASLVLLDWFTAGRVAHGECWAMQRYASRSEVWVRDQPMIIDALVLDRDHGPIADPMRVWRHRCFASVVLSGPAFAEGAAVVHDAINAEPLRRDAKVLAVASRCRAGVIVRIAGERTEAVGRLLRDLLGVVGDVMGDDPWSRKW